MTNKERREPGLPYRYDDPTIMGDQLAYQEKLYHFNATRLLEVEKKQKLLRERRRLPCRSSSALELGLR